MAFPEDEQDPTAINAVEVEGGHIELRTPPIGSSQKSRGKRKRLAHAREVFVPGPATPAANETPLVAAQTMPAPPPVHVPAAPPMRRAASAEKPTHPKDEPSNDALARWPLVLDHARAVMEHKGYSFDPGALTIRCWRTQLGSYTVGSPPKVQMPGAIDGATVAGDEASSPSDQLLEAVLQMWHMVGHRHGPATYTLDFNWKRAPDGHGGSRICLGDMTLDSPDAIAEQRRGTEQFRRGKEQTGFGSGFGAPPPAPRWGAPSPAPLPIAPWNGPAPAWQPQPVQQGIPQLEEIRRELHAALGSRETSDEVRQLLAQHLVQVQQMMQAAPQNLPVASPPPAAPQISAEEQQYIDEGRFRAMAQRLGWVPADVARQQQAAAIAAAQPPPAPAAAVSTGVGEPVSGLEAMLRSLERLDSIKPRLAALAGVPFPDPDAEVEKPEKPEDKNPLGLTEVPGTGFLGHRVMVPTKTDGVVETGQAFLMANPAVAVELVQKIGSLLSSKPVMSLIERITGTQTAPAPAPPRLVPAAPVPVAPRPLPPPVPIAAPVAPPQVPAVVNGASHMIPGAVSTPPPARPVFRGHTA